MSAEVHKVLITTFSLVLYPVKIPEKGSFEDYFGSFIHCIYSLEPVLMWPCKSMVSRRYFSDFLIYELFNLYQCRALYRRIKQTEKTKQELARSLKTATSKVSQLEVSNSLSKVVL